jgi:serine/threonine protein kinase
VRLLDQHEDSERVYLVLEHCPHGDLYKLLRRSGPLEEDSARNFVRQLLLGLVFLHERNVVHRYARLSPFELSRNPS